MSRPTTSRRGYSLMELAVASAVGTIIVGALGSAVVLAAGSLPAASTGEGGLLDTGEALARIASELEQADYIARPSAREIRVVLPDRDGNGAPEVIEYAWAGSDGDPVTRTDDFGDPADALADVGRFVTSLTTAESTEVYTGPQTSSEQVVDSLQTVDGSSEELSIDALYVFAQDIQLNLPVACISWRPIEISFYGRDGGDAASHNMRLQIRERAGDGSPSETVLADTTMAENDLPKTDAWYTQAWADAPWIDVGGNDCLLIGCTSKTGTGARLTREREVGVGMWQGQTAMTYWTPDGSTPSGWTFTAGRELLFRLKAECLVQEPDGSVTWRRVIVADVGAESSGVSMQRLARVVNAPLDVTAFWDADFSSDPTALDLNADATPDWVTVNAAPFNELNLSGGVWSAARAIAAQPAPSITTPALVEVTWRQETQGVTGGEIVIAAAQGGGRQAIILLDLKRVNLTMQCVILSYVDESDVTQVLVEHPVNHLDMVDTRLLIDPDADTVNLVVDGVEVGSYVYGKQTYAADKHVITVGPVGAGGTKFDRVRILTGAGS